MILHLCYEFIREVWSGSGALSRSFVWVVLSTLPNPSWIDPGASASDRAQHLAPQTLTPSKKAGLEHFVVVGDGKGSHFMHLLPNALHLTLQARYLHSSGCHFELKQLGFTAAYRARKCLLIPRNTFISILRAGLLQPHGSESGTWHNRDLIRRVGLMDQSIFKVHGASSNMHEKAFG
jgi:hypothetical protein